MPISGVHVPLCFAVYMNGLFLILVSCALVALNTVQIRK